MNNPVLDSEPDIKENLKNDLEFYEIRGNDALLVEEWFTRMIVACDLLSLYGQGLVEVNGVKRLPDGTFEPTFKQK